MKRTFRVRMFDEYVLDVEATTEEEARQIASDTDRDKMEYVDGKYEVEEATKEYRVSLHFSDIDAVSPQAAAEYVWDRIFSRKPDESMIFRVAPEQEQGPMEDEVLIEVANGLCICVDGKKPE